MNPQFFPSAPSQTTYIPTFAKDFQNPRMSHNSYPFAFMGSVQAIFFRYKALQIQRYQNALLGAKNTVPQLKYEPEAISTTVSNLCGLKEEHCVDKTFQEPDHSSASALQSFAFSQPKAHNLTLRMELRKMITFLLTHMNKISHAQIEAARNQYLSNPILLQIYDKLVMKYYSAKKCREDIVRYILRKIFKLLRTSIIRQERVDIKKASVLLCKKYFQVTFDRLKETSFVDVEDEEGVLGLLMPYNKKSRNRTMNTNFVHEIFSSEQFREEYERFVPKFRSLIEEDNEKKINNLLNFTLECIKNGNLAKFNKFNRLPWLEVWIDETEHIAATLMPKGEDDYANKKSRK